MNAKEARELAEQNLNGPVIEPLMEFVIGKIKEACEVGRRSIHNPLPSYKKNKGSQWGGVSSEEQEAVFNVLRNLGYKVERHKNPDPGHPCSSDYDEIKW